MDGNIENLLKLTDLHFWSNNFSFSELVLENSHHVNQISPGRMAHQSDI